MVLHKKNVLSQKQEAIDLAKELKIGGFQQTKFWSNGEDVVKCLPDSERNKLVQEKFFFKNTNE